VRRIAFEWDSPKRAQFLGDTLSITIPSPETEEERFVIIGMSSGRNLLVVVHTVRGERIRLISARRATKNERRNSEETGE
jgi:uncharacterized DUF497 family protein